MPAHELWKGSAVANFGACDLCVNGGSQMEEAIRAPVAEGESSPSVPARLPGPPAPELS